MDTEPRFSVVSANGIEIHCARFGQEGRTPLLCLHGFPEFWRAWADVAARLADRFDLVLPDQRGFNLSSRPAELSAYTTRTFAADMLALAETLWPGQRFVLAGHDWGSAVAYAMAFAAPARIGALVIANGVHPVCFQRAILEDPGQRAASQYMNRLRAADAEALLSADGYARLTAMIEGFSATPWMDDDTRAAYLDAWRQPGALTGMLNWYRASPVIVPAPDETDVAAPILELPAETMRVAMPHLVLWGDADRALRPACLEGLEDFCDDLTVKRFAGASHWILHEQPDAVADAIAAFLDPPAAASA